MTEKRLIRLAIQGDEKAWNKLYAKYHGMIMGQLALYTKCSELRKDLSQEIWLLIFRHIKKFEGRSELSSWIYVIVLNTFRMHFRYKKHKPAALYGSDVFDLLKHYTPIDDINPHRALVAKRSLQKVYERSQLLPFDRYQVWKLIEVLDVPGVLCTKILNRSNPAIKSDLHRARDVMKQVYNDDDIREVCNL